MNDFYEFKDQSQYVEQFKIWADNRNGAYMEEIPQLIIEFSKIPGHPDKPEFIQNQLLDFFYGWPAEEPGILDEDQHSYGCST